MDTVLDTKTGKIEKIIERTSNSLLITQTKVTDKGINCTNWYNMDDRNFKDRFIINK